MYLDSQGAAEFRPKVPSRPHSESLCAPAPTSATVGDPEKLATLPVTGDIPVWLRGWGLWERLKYCWLHRKLDAHLDCRLKRKKQNGTCFVPNHIAVFRPIYHPYMNPFSVCCLQHQGRRI